jgi:hypothetical protein
MLERGFIDSARQMKAIDEWHYQVKGEMRLWNKKEGFLADIFNNALKKAGYTVAVNVKFVPKDEESFVIDLSDRTVEPYYLLICYDGHYKSVDDPVLFSHSIDDLYLSLIGLIFQMTSDTENRLDEIRSMMESNCYDSGEDRYVIFSVRPENGITEGMCLVFNEEEVFEKDPTLRFEDKKRYSDVEWEEAVERFNDDGLTVRTLKRWGDAN